MSEGASLIINAMTVDVEDYFQVSAFERHIPRDDWDRIPCRVERNTHHILDLLADRRIRATFFTLGWIAERYPHLIQRIVAEGHELACHGYAHVRVSQQSPTEFREDVTRAKELLEDISGSACQGYRAASYSIGADNLWALAVLQELGFRYSSSIYPVKHDLYGMPEAPRFPFHPSNAPGLLEIPITTLAIANQKLPCGGGGYFRLFPYAMSRWALKRVNDTERRQAIFYFHPWEIDPGQPRQSGISLKTRFRHYLNLSRMEYRLKRLFEDFRWDSVESVFFPDLTQSA